METATGRENTGAIGAKGTGERDRGRIQTLIRDSIIELSQGGRFRLHFQLFAGKRSANTVPGTLDNVQPLSHSLSLFLSLTLSLSYPLTPHLGHRCPLSTGTPFSTILPLSLFFSLSPYLSFLPPFSLSLEPVAEVDSLA